MSSNAFQGGLFGHDAPRIDASFHRAVRHRLQQGAWVEHTPGFLLGHETVFEHLRCTTRWRSEQRRMYERVVDVPRLVATLPEDGPGHPILRHAARIIIVRYGVVIRKATVLLYRNGEDSVAPHSDRGEAARPGCMTITLSVGTPRSLHVRSKLGGSARVYRLGWGDLFAMGPTLQQSHVHGVPKVCHAAPRIAVVFWCHLRERRLAG